MATGERFKAKVFMEGIEVPYRSIQIVSGINSPAMASINLVPHYTIRHIRPKTLVHIGVKDYTNKQTDAWELAMDGEVFGRAWGKDSASRSQSVSIMDFSGYWDEADIYFFDPKMAGGQVADYQPFKDLQEANKDAAIIQAATGILSGLAALIGKQGTSDLVGGIKNVIDHVYSMNKLYGYAESRLRTSERLAYTSAGLTKTLFDTARFGEFIVSSYQTQGGFAKLRDALLTLTQSIFHNIIASPFPSVRDSNLHQLLVVPDAFMLAPPLCNILFPSQYTSLNFNRNFRQEPTRLTFNPQMPNTTAEGTAMLFKDVFSPISFSQFMDGSGKDGTDSFDRNAEANKAYGKNKDIADQVLSIKAREHDFFTNEEMMNGINYARAPIPSGMSRLIYAKEAGSTFRAIADYMFFKTRYAYRTITIPCKFTKNIVPGFPMLVLDDSIDKAHLVGLVTQIEHTIAHDNASTNVTLQYVREVDEISSSTGTAIEPPIPPWYDPKVFGSVDPGQRDSAIASVTKDPDEISYLKEFTGATNFAPLGSFYQSIIGCGAVTDAKVPYILPAAVRMLNEYRKHKAQGPDAVDNFIARTTKRDIVARLQTAFDFIGAGTNKKLDSEDVTFTNNGKKHFDGVSVEHKKVVKARKAVVEQYVKALKGSRGHRG